MLIDKVSIPEAVKGNYRIERFKVDRLDFHSIFSGRDIPIGETFTRLMHKGVVVMSDTPAEMRDIRSPVMHAKSSCLINGLGLGMVLKAILKKEEVNDVTVIEISQDVLDLVSPSYSDDRVEFVCCNAFDYKPPKGKRYAMVWHDIWNDICADNLTEMHRLHRKYGKCSDWQGSWCRYQCQRAKDRW